MTICVAALLFACTNDSGNAEAKEADTNTTATTTPADMNNTLTEDQKKEGIVPSGDEPKYLSALSESTLSGFVTASYFYDTSTPADRTYYDAEAKIIWHGRPRWLVDLAYQYRRQEFDEPVETAGEPAGDSAESNALWLTMRYTWQRMDLSR